METKLEYYLTNSHKADMISYMKSHPKDFNEVIKLAISDKQPYSWRAAWILWSCMDKNDIRLRRHVKKMIDILPERKENQQRELLMILQRIEINKDYEGQLFNVCTRIWRKTVSNPSLRYNAFRVLFAIAKKHPDLSDEIKSLTESHYTDTLSDSVKKSIARLKKELKEELDTKK